MTEVGEVAPGSPPSALRRPLLLQMGSRTWASEEGEAGSHGGPAWRPRLLSGSEEGLQGEDPSLSLPCLPAGPGPPLLPAAPPHFLRRTEAEHTVLLHRCVARGGSVWGGWPEPASPAGDPTQT